MFYVENLEAVAASEGVVMDWIGPICLGILGIVIVTWGIFVTNFLLQINEGTMDIESKLDLAHKQQMIFVDAMTRLVEVLEKKDED